MWAARVSAQRTFVSKDADIFGDRAMARKLADAAGGELNSFTSLAPLAVAALTKRRPDAETITVEVLRGVRGLIRKDLSDADLVELRPGQICAKSNRRAFRTFTTRDYLSVLRMTT